MPSNLKPITFLRRCGVRRLTFFAFCLTLVVAAALYLGAGPHERDYGFAKALPPAMALFAALAIATPWLVPRYRLPALATAATDHRNRGWFWGGVGIAGIAAAIHWSPRLEMSLWTDEGTSMRENIVGRWKHRNDDRGGLRRPSWAETFFEYKTPNNHALYSAVARVTHEGLNGINGTDFSRPYFSEPVLRLPALVAALASLPLLGYLALRLGSLLAAWLAMSWAVLHPWYLEFATSARGYTFAMCFIALALVAALRIFRDGGGWRWWVVYGAAQFLAFFTVATVAHGLIFLNVAVFGGILLDKSVDPRARRAHLGAFFAVNLAATALALATFMPKYAQFQEYLNSGHFRFNMPLDWMGDNLSNFFVGHPFHPAAEDNPWLFATDQWPAALLVIAILVALASLAGALWHSRRSGVFALLLAATMLLPPFTVYLQARAMQFYFFQWYAAWHLPLWIALFSIGAAALIALACKGRPRWLPVAATAVLVFGIGAATHRERNAFLSMSVEPQREAAALMRSSPNPYAPGHQDIITVSIITANHSYDPWNRRVRNVEDLMEQVAYADETGRPLYCDTGWENAKAMAQDFEQYLNDHRDEIEVLSIFFSQPARRSEVTYGMIKALLERLKQDRPKLARCGSGRLMLTWTTSKATTRSVS